MADISTITKKGITYNIKDSTARSGIESLKQADDAFTADIKKLYEELSNLQVGSGGCNCTLKDGEYNVLAINHRGYCTVAPENTIPAYILSKEKGFNYAECDVSFTSDGVAVLLHDATIDRTSDGSGNISNLTYAEVLQYDFGSWKSADYTGTKIPTFEEFIKLCKNVGLHPYIELKSNGAYTEAQIKSLVDIVTAHGMKGKVTYISFDAEYLRYVKVYDASARLGYLVSSVTTGTIAITEGLRSGRNEVFLDSSDYDDDAVRLCIEAGIPLEIWTVNSASTIENMNPYISGVTSDNQIAGKILHDKSMIYTPPTVEELTLTSISATYTGENVVVGTSVSSLSGVVVTGTYSNGTTAAISGYILSGQIVEGENIITVTYGGLTTTFTVIGVAESSGGGSEGGDGNRTLLHSWDLATSMVDTVGGVAATTTGSQSESGVTIGAEKQYIDFGLVFDYNRTYELDVANLETQGGGNTYGRLFVIDADSATDAQGSGLVRRGTGWDFYTWNTGGWNTITTLTALSNNYFSGKTVVIKIDASGYMTLFADGEALATSKYALDTTEHRAGYSHVWVGGSNDYIYNCTISCFRVYDGV